MAHLQSTLLVLPVLGSLAIAGIAGAADYVIIDLSTLAGFDDTNGPGSQAYGISDDGVICGLSVDASPQRDLHPILWDQSLVDLGILGSDVHGIAFAINNSGVAAGVTLTLGDTTPQAVRWVGVSGAGLGTWAARDVNEPGVIVGEKPATESGAWGHAVRWTAGTLLDLGTLGGLHSSAFAINDAGRIVGHSLLANNTTSRAFLWQGGAMSDLGTLGGVRSQAFDISNSGFVVGVADGADARPHAFRYTLAANGSVTQHTDLGELGSGSSIAYAVNEAGDAVGSSDWRAFLWRDGVMTDLNTAIGPDSGWLLTHATAINESGQIAGRGTHFGNPRAFLLTPRVPADLNGDGIVDGADLGLLLSAWGTAGPEADLDGSGVVDGADLGLVLSAWS